MRTFIWFACALNLGLILSIVRQGDRAVPPSTGLTTAEPTPATQLPPSTNQPAPAALIATNAEATTLTNRPPFRWEQIESEDYLQLIQNLRAIGCPDTTIRDLVTARVHDDFGAAAWKVQRPLQPGFWELVGQAQDINDLVIPKQIEDQLEAIQAEKRTTLDAVSKQFAEEKEPYRLNSDRWSFLSSEQREQVRSIHEQIEHTRKELTEELSRMGDSADPALRESLKGLNAKRDEAIKTVIGEENWARYDATRNRSASWIRSLAGLTASPEEMQQIARQRDALERQRKPHPREGTPEELDEYRLVKDDIDRKQEELLANVLGEERAGHVQRAADGDYRTMRNVARRHGLSMDVANHAYEVKQSAQTQLNELLARDLPAGDRLKATAALLLTVKAELAGIYGDQAWPAYENYGMKWFDRLTASAEMVEENSSQPPPQP